MRTILFLLLLTLSVSAFSQVEKIRVLSIQRYNQQGYITVSAQYRVLIPNPLGSSAQVWRVLRSYANNHGIVRIDTIGGSRYAVVIPEAESQSLPRTKTQIRNFLVNKLTELETKMNNLVNNLEPFDTMLGESYIDNTWQLSPLIDSL